MPLNWAKNDYFSSLALCDERGNVALEMFVDDIHLDKVQTISEFIKHDTSLTFLWDLIRLLGNKNTRVAGNAAYIVGTLAESDLTSAHVLSALVGSEPESRNILAHLTALLQSNDPESVMNAAGTIGTLAESREGREWLLQEPCLDNTIVHITHLLSHTSLWTASNAALVLARLTISEEGCYKLLRHQISDRILDDLISSLTVDEAGRGMNAAFAIGRLCDVDEGRCRILLLSQLHTMISSLSSMLHSADIGACKNSCFALSCLATSPEGHSQLMNSSHVDELVVKLAQLMSSDDSESGWFAAMTLRTIASQQAGCRLLRNNNVVLDRLKAMEMNSSINHDLREEVLLTLEILKPLQKPSPPIAEAIGSNDVVIKWFEITNRNGFNVTYQLYQDCDCVYNGCQLSCTVENLLPFTDYCFRLRAVTACEEGPFSDTVTVTTQEAVPGPPVDLVCLTSTTSQLKIAWQPPTQTNGLVKMYYVYIGDKLVEHTNANSAIISGLHPSTSCDLSVCAATSKGKGPREYLTAATTDLGEHAPSKLEVIVRGRSELYVTWRPPAVPLGRIFKYEVSIDGHVVNSGTDLYCVVKRLKADTEYNISVSAVTSEGRCESKALHRRTAKDEYEVNRAPLYQNPQSRKQEIQDRISIIQKTSKTIARKSLTGDSDAEPLPSNESPVDSGQFTEKPPGNVFRFAYSKSELQTGEAKLPRHEIRSSESNSSIKTSNLPLLPEAVPRFLPKKKNLPVNKEMMPIALPRKEITHTLLPNKDASSLKKESNVFDDTSASAFFPATIDTLPTNMRTPPKNLSRSSQNANISQTKSDDKKKPKVVNNKYSQSTSLGTIEALEILSRPEQPQRRISRAKDSFVTLGVKATKSPPKILVSDRRLLTYPMSAAGSVDQSVSSMTRSAPSEVSLQSVKCKMVEREPLFTLDLDLDRRHSIGTIDENDKENSEKLSEKATKSSTPLAVNKKTNKVKVENPSKPGKTAFDSAPIVVNDTERVVTNNKQTLSYIQLHFDESMNSSSSQSTERLLSRPHKRKVRHAKKFVC